MLDALLHDLRYAARHLQRSPGFSAAAILTLALGIGANTAMFSVLNALVLRTLPIKDPHGLVGVSSRSAQGQLRLTLISAVPELQREGPFADVCGVNGGGIFAADVNGAPLQTAIALVTGRCFNVFGVEPMLGRAITDQDAPIYARGNLVTVIGHRFWARMFGSDPNVVGQTVRMEGVELTVIGVMPPGFGGIQADVGVDIWVPFYTISPIRADRPAGASHILGRLKPGVTLAQAEAELVTRWPALLEATVPPALAAPERRQFVESRARVERLATGVSFYRDRYERPLTIIFGLTLVLLALACVNLGGLLVSRLAERGAELGVRVALGGSGARIAQQMMIESVVLSLAGAALAVPASFAFVAVLASFVPNPLVERTVSFTPDLRVLAATAACGVAAGLLTSLVPIWLAWQRRGAITFAWDRTVASHTNRWARALLVAQVALSVVMLASAILLGRSLYLLQRVDLGVRAENVLNVRIMPLPNAYRTIDNASYYPALLDQVSALPGVRAVGLSRVFPRLVGPFTGQVIRFAGQPEGELRAQVETISPGFLEAVSAPLLRGRPPAWSDHARSQPVALVSNSLARQLAPDGDVLGRRVRFGAEERDIEIVGVVGDISMGNPRLAAPAVLYRPTLQMGLFANYPNLMAAVSGDPLAIAPAIRDILKQAGREYAHDIRRLDDLFVEAPAAERMGATLAGATAALAVLLAFIGIYSLLAYSVSRRTREIGVRVAIGADRADVLRMVMKEGLILATIGTVVGVPAAIAAGRILGTLLFGLTASDPIVLSSTAAFFVALGLVAGLVPAFRAAAVDPAIALRAE